jgi:hypothetical protein
MLAYNRSIGADAAGREGSAHGERRQRGRSRATVHWHGIRLENRYDGTHETQAPIPVGETFTYEVELPDPGVYWYHPHIREDYGQELGLYGNILVVPAEAEYWPPAHRELLLTLDDVLVEDGRIAAFSASETTHVAMGRFGNVMLVAGEPELALEHGGARSNALPHERRTPASSVTCLGNAGTGRSWTRSCRPPRVRRRRALQAGECARAPTLSARAGSGITVPTSQCGRLLGRSGAPHQRRPRAERVGDRSDSGQDTRVRRG